MKTIVEIKYKNNKRTFFQKLFGLNKIVYLTELRESDICIKDSDGKIHKCKVEEITPGTYSIESNAIITSGIIMNCITDEENEYRSAVHEL